MHKAISKFYINILICDYFVVTLIPKNYTMLCIVPTPYSDSMGVNIGKGPSLYSDKHGGVKVKPFLRPVDNFLNEISSLHQNKATQS